MLLPYYLLTAKVLFHNLKCINTLYNTLCKFSCTLPSRIKHLFDNICI